MKISIRGEYYESFQFGRIFIVERKDCVTLKAFKTYKGEIYKFLSWICLSWRSTSPIAYQFCPGLGLTNITYHRLSQRIDGLLARVSQGRNEAKCDRVREKFTALCNQFSTYCFDIDSINIEYLRIWLPLLRYYKHDEVLKTTPILAFPEVRAGFKKDSFKSAIDCWFGRSPKGLVKQRLKADG